MIIFNGLPIKKGFYRQPDNRYLQNFAVGTYTISDAVRTTTVISHASSTQICLTMDFQSILEVSLVKSELFKLYLNAALYERDWTFRYRGAQGLQ